jgi:16S rRNA C967 or C1407 C5-methylase (RsmB/RsmF family)/NOL1/NOP2/fmu family ribosome biogenesis protein
MLLMNPDSWNGFSAKKVENNNQSLMPALPQKLIAALNKLDHFDEAAFRAVHASDDQWVSVRFNPSKLKIKKGAWPITVIDPAFALAARVPWAENAYYLAERPSFTLDPLFHAGTYYVQEASGMFVEHALRNTVDLSAPLRILDLCAAPGGKSTLIQSVISKSSLLVSNEVIKTRVPVLHQNLDKWGFANGIITHNDPKDFKQLPGFFDVLMVDAPCSGSGLFRKDPVAIGEWSEEAVNLCRQRQQRILADAWDCLKENGVLLYSTCSYSKEENEDVLDDLLQHHSGESLRIPLDPLWNVIETLSEKEKNYGYRFYPDKLNGEGFFLAAVRKKESTLETPKARAPRGKLGRKEQMLLRKFIPDENLEFIPINEGVHIIPAHVLNDLWALKNELYLKKAGVLAGKMGSDEWIPDHELALSVDLNPDLPFLELSRADALQYLRREAFTPATDRKGWMPVGFQHQKLGWAKMLANRINNYYPKAWRILKK